MTWRAWILPTYLVLVALLSLTSAALGWHV